MIVKTLVHLDGRPWRKRPLKWYEWLHMLYVIPLMPLFLMTVWVVLQGWKR